MKKQRLFAFFGILVLAVSMFVVAKPEFTSLANPAEKEVSIPTNAIQVSEGVYSLGTAKDSDGRIVEGFMIVHKKNENAKLSGAGGGSGSGSKCYGFLASEAKWKSLEGWFVNTANTENLNSTFVYNTLNTGIGKWETAGQYNIMGSGAETSSVLTADTSSPDNLNEVYFGSIADSGVIGVTVVWGIFSGPLENRILVEWDQVYDQADFDWSATGEPGKMDFENIATHELGHAVGMADLYTSRCSAQTMYGYANTGETQKRTLESGDKAGIALLY